MVLERYEPYFLSNLKFSTLTIPDLSKSRRSSRVTKQQTRMQVLDGLY